MIINEKLLEAANYDPTKTSHQKSIIDMCNDIYDDKISLPLYQRDISWTLNKCIDLFNYQLLGKAPVSPISINVINNPHENKVNQVNFIDRTLIKDISPKHWSVVDGQQRLTANYKAIIAHASLKNVYLDIGKAKFVENKNLSISTQIPIGILLNKNVSKLENFISKNEQFKEFKVQNLLLRIRHKILGYNYTINLADDLNEDDQINWFEVLNNAGSTVSAVQMAFSKLRMQGIDIYKQYTSIYNDKLINSGYGNLFKMEKTTVSYAISALNPSLEKKLKIKSKHYTPIPSDTKEKRICTLSEKDLKLLFKETLNSLDIVVDFLKKFDSSIVKINRVDYINYIIGFVTLNSISNLDKATIIDLTEWCKNTNFTNLSNPKRRELYSSLLENK